MYIKSSIEGSANAVKIYPNHDALEKIERINLMNKEQSKLENICCKNNKSTDSTLLLLLILLLCTR